MKPRSAWTLWCIACITATLSAGFGVWLPLSFYFTIISEPFADLQAYLIDTLMTAFALAVLCLPLAGVFVFIDLLLRLRTDDKSVDPLQCVSISTIVVVRICQWVSLPILLTGVHLSCWAMHDAISPWHVDWYRRTPTANDLSAVWLILHLSGMTLVVVLWCFIGWVGHCARRLRAGGKACALCGYSLAGLTSKVCPECGEPHGV